MLAELVFECVLGFADLLLEVLLQFSTLPGTAQEQHTAIPRRSWWLPEHTSTESDDHGGYRAILRSSASYLAAGIPRPPSNSPTFSA